jgi:hypothetical protein
MPQTLVGFAKFPNKLSARDNPPILHRCKPSSSAISRFPHLCFNPKPSPTPAIFSQILPVPSANLSWTVSINNRTHIVMQRHPTSNLIIYLYNINQVGWHYTVYCYDLDDVFMTWFMDYIWLYIYNYILWYVKYVMVHESRELTLLTRLTSRYQLWIPFLPSPPRTPCWASRSPPAALRRCSGRRPRWVQRRAWAARRHLGTSEVISERFWKYLKDCRKSRVFVGSLNIPSFSGWTMENRHFFPRAYERRVLPIVGVCKTSFHLLIFTSSHLRIFSSSHPHIFTSSHLHILSCPLALLPSCSLVLFYFSLEGAGQCQRDGAKRNPFARNEVRSPKTA